MLISIVSLKDYSFRKGLKKGRSPSVGQVDRWFTYLAKSRRIATLLLACKKKSFSPRADGSTWWWPAQLLQGFLPPTDAEVQQGKRGREIS